MSPTPTAGQGRPRNPGGAVSGPLLFARYAYPPNELGYCGPADSAELFERAAAGDESSDLRRLIESFEGAWPYLTLIAGAAGRRDPLDPEVVSAYWVGGPLLDAVTPRMLHASMRDRFRPRLGTADWSGFDAAFHADARPHHGFHVFVVYPWVGLLRGGRVDEPLRVLDRCRIRWGQAVSVDTPESGGPGTAIVRYQPLTWDGRRLALGDHRLEAVRHTGGVPTGAWCSLHWDWICEVLDPDQHAALRIQTRQQLAVANAAHRHGPVLP